MARVGEVAAVVVKPCVWKVVRLSIHLVGCAQCPSSLGRMPLCHKHSAHANSPITVVRWLDLRTAG